VDTSFADGIAMTLGKEVGETVREAREYAEVMKTSSSFLVNAAGHLSADTLDAVSSVNRFGLDSIRTAQEFYGQQGGVLGTVGGTLTFAGSALSMVVTSPLTLADYQASDEERARAVVDVGLMLATAGLVKAGTPLTAGSRWSWAFVPRATGVNTAFRGLLSRGASRLAGTRLGQAAVTGMTRLERVATTGARLARTPLDDIFRGAGNLALRQGTRAADALGSTALGRVVQSANQRVLSPLAQYSSRAGGFLNRTSDAARDYFSLVNNFGRGPVQETGQRLIQNASLRAKHATAREYDLIRRSTDDVAQIARNTGMRPSQVARIKDHVFNRTHHLGRGMGRFDPDPEIAAAWRRLQAGTHTADDIGRLGHELFESRVERIFRVPYRAAHEAAERAAQRQAARAAGLEGWRSVGRTSSRGAVQAASTGQAVDGIASARRAGARRPVRPNEITTFDDFRARSQIGDQLEGHELIQHAFLKDRGLATRRFSTEASRKNPVIALDRSQHIDINKAQAALDVAEQRALQHIAENARILREAGVPEAYIGELLSRAIEHARKLGFIGWVKG
jgi:hypothetical protein